LTPTSAKIVDSSRSPLRQSAWSPLLRVMLRLRQNL